MDNIPAYSKISTLAKEWNVSEDDVFEMGSKGMINLSIWWAGNYYIGDWGDGERGDNHLNDFVIIGLNHATEFHLNSSNVNDEGVHIGEGNLRDGRKIHIFKKLPFDVDWTDENDAGRANNAELRPVFFRSSIVVLADEKNRVWSKYAEVIQQLSIQANLAKNLEKEDKPERRNECGEIISSWKGIAEYVSKKLGKQISISTVKKMIGNRKYKNSLVKKGGNVLGGVWAWSQALDHICSVSSVKKKKNSTNQHK